MLIVMRFVSLLLGALNLGLAWATSSRWGRSGP